MKQIALMGLMAAVLAVGIYCCSEGLDALGDGGAVDAGEMTDGTDSSDGGLPDTNCDTWRYDQWKEADDTVASFTDPNPCNWNTDCTSLATGTSCNPNCSVVVSVSTYNKKKAELDKVSAKYCTEEMIQACGTSGVGCADAGMPVCINGQCGRGDHWVGDAGYDGSTDPDASNDGGTPDSGGDGGTTDTGVVANCGPSPTGKGGDMCLVPAGPFMMGCNTAVDTECQSNEYPYHQVTVPAFKIDRYEVTASEYKVCVDSGECTATILIDSRCTYGVAGKDSHPINCVDWNLANTYCTWAGKRLPTEAEWEKSARGTDGRKYPWGNTGLNCDHAVWNDSTCGNSGTAPVGSKPQGASPYGALDMMGNVWEWVEDDWHQDHQDYTGAPTDGSAWVDNPRSPYCIQRGGAWNQSYSVKYRTSFREGNDRPAMSPYFGFRCAVSQ